MCQSPNKLWDGTLVACRKCDLCKDNYIKDWTGRCIAEYKTTNHAYFVTLTYGRDENDNPDHIRAYVLTYSDFQKYAKRLRKTIGKFKYIVAGEYGSRKGRAHFHALLFTQEPIRGVEFGKMIHQPDWVHGHSKFKPFKIYHARYCCKYVQKDVHDRMAFSKFQMSKKPPLGHEYFQELAQRYVDAGLAPQDLKYSFNDIRKSNGDPIKFLMRGKTAENFLDHYIKKWQERHGKILPTIIDLIKFNYELPGRDIPQSEIIEKHIQKRMAQLRQKYLTQYGRRNLEIIRENYGKTSQNARIHVANTSENEYTAYCLKTGEILALGSKLEKVEANAKRIAQSRDKEKRFHNPDAPNHGDKEHPTIGIKIPPRKAA